ncbi:hypothetical protein [Opitutus terrae]|uniref:PBS lyase HEAT domain protein repeat-containing protein n=1 Tax=Opitutus terrae (strain DSM 11246 / JCM 15787 / PB90-1) TaxID=452637 RepID=B1ZVC0_OPITP|nr:hypothetical protein [Opitutus terrae]ACB76787.1 hypothetical protein Oter_3510 [Opitutus terrae PB90-1]
MVDDSPQENTSEGVQSVERPDLQERDRWFTATPDPWREIVRLEFGGDRSFASTVQQMVLNADRSQWPELEARLITALGQAELTVAGRQFICRTLGWIGSAQCVPAAAALLRRDDSADDARLALDGLDDPAVGGAYREALGWLRGRAKLGVIGSIVTRNDTAAVERLTAIALDEKETPEVRAGAERAVERLAGRAST